MRVVDSQVVADRQVVMPARAPELIPPPAAPPPQAVPPSTSPAVHWAAKGTLVTTGTTAVVVAGSVHLCTLGAALRDVDDPSDCGSLSRSHGCSLLSSRCLSCSSCLGDHEEVGGRVARGLAGV